MVVSASTGGLRADSCENLARHASASSDFGSTYASRKHARWLLAMHNNHHCFLTRSENVRCTCATLKNSVRWPCDLNCTNDVRRSHLSLALYMYVRWRQVACAHHQHINWTHSKRTSHLRHAYTNCSWCVRIAHKQDYYKNYNYEKNPNKDKRINGFAIHQNQRF